MNHLHRHLSLVSSGSGSCVLLEGEAGTGKSRLLSEFKKSLDHRGVQWLQGNAYTYARNVPYLPVIDLLKRVADVRYEDSQDTVRRKLTAQFDSIWDTAGEVPQIIERLFTLSNANAPQIPP